MGTKVPKEYGKGHYSCCPWGYGHGYNIFYKRGYGKGYCSTLPIWYPLPSLFPWFFSWFFTYSFMVSPDIVYFKSDSTGGFVDLMHSSSTVVFYNEFYARSNLIPDQLLFSSHCFSFHLYLIQRSPNYSKTKSNSQNHETKRHYSFSK